MSKFKIPQFIQFLHRMGISVYAPEKLKEGVFVRKVTDPHKVKLHSDLPFYSFKQFLIPKKETLLKFNRNEIIRTRKVFSPQMLFGLNLVDIKSFNLWNHVFEKDEKYIRRRDNTYVVAHSEAPKETLQNIFHTKFERDILEHLHFDIFLEKHRSDFYIYTGTRKGRELLEQFGFTDYLPVEYNGPEEIDIGRETIKHNLINHNTDKLWNELAKTCIDCGKCSVVCPTCFCFDICDEQTLEPGVTKRCRQQTSCFYQDFSKVAGEHKFLNNTAAHLKFWYYHKFVRIPTEYGFDGGCIGCGRCFAVCPVAINIFKNLDWITKH